VIVGLKCECENPIIIIIIINKCDAQAHTPQMCLRNTNPLEKLERFIRKYSRNKIKREQFIQHKHQGEEWVSISVVFCEKTLTFRLIGYLIFSHVYDVLTERSIWGSIENYSRRAFMF